MESGEERKSGAGARRLAVLFGLLAAAGAAYWLTGGLRERYLAEAELMRREVQLATDQDRAEAEAVEARRERAGILERLAGDPEEYDLLLRAGALYARDRRHDDALFMLHEARRVRPDAPEVYRALYESYISQARYDRAYDSVDAGLRHAPRDLELVLSMVHLDTLVGWNNHARSLLRRLQGTPEAENPRALIASALVYRQLADSRHAEMELLAASRRDGANAKIHALLSGVYWETGKAPEAEASIRRALEIEPDSADYRIHLAEIERAKRTPAAYAAALRTAEEALRADPGNQHAFFAIAQALLAQKKTDQARDVLEKLLQRYPDHAQASMELGKIYVRGGREAEGRRMLEEYAARIRLQDELKGLHLKAGMQAETARHQVALGRLLTDTASPEKAVLVLRRALQLSPEDAQARRELGRALQAAGRGGEYGALVRRPGWHVLDLMDQGDS